MPIKISLVEDVSSVIKGSEDASRAFDKVADSLDDLAREAKQSGDKLGDGISDGVKDASKSVERLDDTFADMVRSVKRDSKKLGDDLGDDVKRGAREAESGLDEFKSEASSTARESAASFDGSADDIADSFQEVAANALAGFGPIGAAAGLALAVGFGTFLARTKEDTEKAKQAVSDMYDDMLQSGADFLSREFIADQIGKIYQGAEDAAIKINDLRKLAETSNIPEPLLARALVGDQAARDRVKTAITEQRAALTATLDEATAKGGNMAPVLAPAIKALQDIEKELAGTSESFGEAQKNASAASAAVNGIIAPTKGAAASAEDARAKYNGLGQEIANLPAPVIRPELDLSEARRAMRQFSDGSYQVTVRGRVTGMRIV